MFAALVSFVGLPAAQGSGYTLASLRGGGATALYLLGASLEHVAWLGRWASKRTLGIYIRKVAALLSLGALPHLHQMRIRRFALGMQAILEVPSQGSGACPSLRLDRAQAAAGL